MMKILYLDLGNTRLKYWLTKRGVNSSTNHEQVLEHMALEHLQAPAELLIGLEDRLDRFAPDFIGVSSVLGVVVNEQVAKQLSKHKIRYDFVKVDAKHPAMHSHYDAKQLGTDRWLQMLSIAKPTEKYCVVGCGTALTIDLVDSGYHLGGYIFPSIHLQRDSIQRGTRQIRIPDGEFTTLKAGHTTADAVHRGILLSIVGAIHEIMRVHADFKLILTGGDAKIIAQHVQEPTVYDNLVLQGMQRYFAGKLEQP